MSSERGSREGHFVGLKARCCGPSARYPMRVMNNRTWLGVGAGVALASVLLRKRFDWRRKVVVITGGARGLGLLLAQEVLRRGGKVAICARDGDEVERAKGALQGAVFGAACDVRDRAELQQFLSRATQALGPIDVLINNAGVIQVGPMEEMTVEDYDNAMRVHFYAPLHAILEVLPQMRRRRAGRIINIASIGAKVAVPHLLPYSASKFALYGLSAGLRAELAKDGIVVTTVCPGLMRTGSARHASMKGQAEAEYAWFKVSSSLPILAMSPERAARQILDASARGQAEVVLSLPAKVLATLHGVMPSFVQNVLGVVTRALPAPGGAGRPNVEGKNVEPPLLTPLTSEIAARNNEF